jgi:SAM-dependent methyltransferase
MVAPAVFTRPGADAAAMPVPRVPMRYAWEYLRDGETPGRVLNDAAVRAFLPFLEGPGTIVELGAGSDWYRRFVEPGQAYELTNYVEGFDRVVDMTAMPFADNSVDAFMSMFALEHVYDIHAAIRESHRCLKPKGRMLLAVPFMYYYHGAPDDFFRFTRSALDRMLDGFTTLRAASFGNRALAVAQFFHEKRVLGSTSPAWKRALYRACCLPMLVSGLRGDQHDPVFAVTHLYLCEKP